jgi:hypothetical protein
MLSWLDLLPKRSGEARAGHSLLQCAELCIQVTRINSGQHTLFTI